MLDARSVRKQTEESVKMTKRLEKLNEESLEMTRETERQGKTLMVFTIVTIVFVSSPLP